MVMDVDIPARLSSFFVSLSWLWLFLFAGWDELSEHGSLFFSFFFCIDISVICIISLPCCSIYSILFYLVLF